MESCIGCGHRASRKRRGIFRKVVCRAAYECDHCGLNWHDFRPLFAIFQSCCLCPRCHNPDLTKLASRDKLDRMSPNPLRFLLGLFGAPLYHCTFCRMQFRDWRATMKTLDAIARRSDGPG